MVCTNSAIKDLSELLDHHQAGHEMLIKPFGIDPTRTTGGTGHPLTFYLSPHSLIPFFSSLAFFWIAKFCISSSTTTVTTYTWVFHMEMSDVEYANAPGLTLERFMHHKIRISVFDKQPRTIQAWPLALSNESCHV